jgi:type I restriction enzyme S subunit
MASNGWDTLPLDEAVQVNPSVPLQRGEAYPFVDMQAVDPASRSVGPSEMRAFTGGGSRFIAGDTLMARITPCLENGKIARFAPNGDQQLAHGSTEFIVIRGKPGVTDNDFAYYLTKWDGVRLYCISQMTGTSGRQRVPTDSLSHCEVTIPPLKEQRAIACILGTLDDKIELNRRRNQTLEALARAIFQSWFVDFDPVKAKAAVRREHPRWTNAQVSRAACPKLKPEIAELFPDRFEDSPLGPIPKGWRVTSLADEITANKGLSYKGDFLAEPGQGLPMHNLNSVYEGGGYKHEGLKWYTGEYRPVHLLKPGDVIVTNTEQGFDYLLIGYAAIVPKRYGDKGLFSHHIYRIQAKDTSYLPTWFIYLLLRTPVFHELVAGHSNGTTVNMLPLDGLQKPRFVLPPEQLVRHFGKLFEPTQQQLEVMHDENVTLAALRDALLPKLISGELRVPDAERIVGRAV